MLDPDYRYRRATVMNKISEMENTANMLIRMNEIVKAAIVYRTMADMLYGLGDPSDR